jgi:predicted CxxxxCH...CXXCH cytochrome family protein
VVEVTFSGLAVKGGAVPTYSGGLNGKCSGVYCHGATLDAGGKLASPSWNDGALRCDACHGSPPSKNHDASLTACATCHPGTVKPDGTINVAGGLHANGTVESSTTHAAGWSDPTRHGYAAKTGLSTCRSCHGQNLDGVGGTASSCARCHAADGYANWQSNCTFCHGARITTYDAASLRKAAPPKGNHGDTSTSARAVGAHQKHLAGGGGIGPAVDCAECHVVPTDLAHLDGSAAVTFGANARRDGARPVWNGATCASVYCHGGTLAGGSNNAPTWTSGSSQTTCGTCHGVPPPEPHVRATACEQCHTGYTSTTVNATLHLNGKIDATAQHPAGWAARDLHGYAANRKGLSTCAACHGADYAGGASGVSCNSCHASSGWATWQTNCTFCHGTRVTAYTSASLSSSAPPAGTEGEYATTTVAVGAHQKHLKGGSIGPAVACDTCHVVPADLAHASGGVIVTFGAPASIGGLKPTWNGTTCASTYCHGEGLVGGVNTRPTWTGGPSQTTCGACHGVPPGTPHSTSTSCGTCHDGYTATSVNLSLHINGKIDATAQHPANWANKDQHGYSVNKSGLTSCKSCHGTDLNGGTAQSCTTCHASAGFSGWAASCTFCHGSRAAGGLASPPVDTQGGNAVSNVSVGAHAVHMGTQLMNTPACSACHPDRTASNVITDTAHIDGNGVAEVTFGALAKTGGAAATYTRTSATAASCASVYCHGQFTGGASATMSWTSTTPLSCTSCHGSPPASGTGHPSTTADCGGCHSGYTRTTVNKATHINGTIESSAYHTVANWAFKENHGYAANKGLSGCTSCHGTDYNGGTSGVSCNACHTSKSWSTWQTNCTFCHGTRVTSYSSANLSSAAPPVGTQGTTATTDVAVGAHAKHLAGGTIGSAVACSACHTVPTNLSHVNGTPVVTITGLGAQGTTASWNDTAGTCSTYCHGATLLGGTRTAPSWVGGSSQTACGSCHGSPPSSGKHSNRNHVNRDCGDCHPGYTRTSVNRSTHINGSRQVGNKITSWSGGRCSTSGSTGCHGSGTQTW